MPSDVDDEPPSPAVSNPPTEGLPSPIAPPTGTGGFAGGAPPPDPDAYDYEAPPGSEEPIRVLVRVRPHSTGGKAETASGHVGVEPPDTLRVSRAKQGEVRARFDAVLGGVATQDEVFQHVGPAVDAAMAGINATVFAYGQTGSGKTFTLFGGMLQGDPPPRREPEHATASEGMACRALRLIYARAEAAAAQGMRVAVSCSFLEVYNEHITDLLLPSTGRAAWGGGTGGLGADGTPALALCQDDRGEVHVRGLSEVPVHHVGQALTLVRRALRGRAVRQTDMNSRSSRSHAVLQLVIEMAPAAQAHGGGGGGGGATRARLNLVDLAGSERMPTGTTDGGPGLARAHQAEMGHINKSLSALANCIAALSSKDRTHVPYRDSVLTRLLQASLGGNSRTLLIATVSPADKCVDESLSTLRFADRAKHVMLKATSNHTDIGDTLVQQRRRFEARIDRLQQEVGRLRTLLEQRDAERHPAQLSLGGGGGEAAEAMRLERERLKAMMMMESDGAARDGGGRGGAESAGLQRTVNTLVGENEKLRGLLGQRDAELLAERAEVQRLKQLLAAAGGGGEAAVAMQQQQQQQQPPRKKGSEAQQRASPRQPQYADDDGSAAAAGGGDEADGMLKEVMEELRLQEQELRRIREEEQEIEALLARSGGRGGRQGGTRSYGGGGLPGGAAYGGAKMSPRQQQQQAPQAGSGGAGGYGYGLPPPPPPAYGSSYGGGAVPHYGGGGGGRGRKAEHTMRSDHSSVHYDPRADPNSRYYDPELDPNSKWFNPGGMNGGGAHSSASGGGVSGSLGGMTGSQSARAAQPPYGSAWNGSAYGVPPRSAEPPPNSPPPKRNGGGGGNGRSRRNGNRSGVTTGGGHHGPAMTAVSALAASSGPTDIGSLYYVLGSQASSSRVKQLQKMLELRRGAEESQRRQEEATNRLIMQ